MEMPESLQWLMPIVVGASWPEGDEEKLRAMRDAWTAAAKSVEEVLGDGNNASKAALGCMSGQTAEKFEEYWQKYVEGDAYLVNLQQICTDLAAGCDNAALGVEYTKLSIIFALGILAIQIAAMIASAVATFGTSTAGIPIAQAATRITVQMIFQQLVKQILINVAINVGVDAAIQGIQFAKGDRKSWDVGKTVDAGIAGVAAGCRVGSGRHRQQRARHHDQQLRPGRRTWCGRRGHLGCGRQHPEQRRARQGQPGRLRERGGVRRCFGQRRRCGRRDEGPPRRPGQHLGDRDVAEPRGQRRVEHPGPHLHDAGRVDRARRGSPEPVHAGVEVRSGLAY